MAITTQDIHHAADKIVSEGGSPTLSAVRKELGGGSFTTISDEMKSWKAAHSKQLASTPIREPAPASVSEKLTEFGSALWGMALEMANARLQSEREAIEQVRQELEQTQKEAIDLADQLSTELEQAQILIDQQAEAIEKAEVESKAMVIYLESEKTERDKAERKAETATAALTESHHQVKALNEQIGEIKIENKSARSEAAENYKKAVGLDSELAIATDRLQVSRSEVVRYTLELEKMVKALADKEDLIKATEAKFEKALADKDNLVKSITDKLDTAVASEIKSAQSVKLLEGKIEGMASQNKIYIEKTAQQGHEVTVPATVKK